MGLETAALVAGGSQVVGQGLQYFENRAARKRAEKASGQALDITSQTGAAEQQILAMFNRPNAGQDSYMQYLRANPGALDPFMYDQSKAFKGLQVQDTQVLNDQLNKLRAGAGSLGERFGTGFASRQAVLQSRYGADIAARNAGISQQSFGQALQTGLGDYTATQGRVQQLLALLQQGEFTKRGQQLQALGFGASQPQYQGAGSQIAQTGGDIGQLLLLMKFFGGGGGGGSSIPYTAGSPPGGGYR